MKVLFDTNIVLDLLLDRKPFSEFAAQLFTKVEKGQLSGVLCGTTITTIEYLARKSLGARGAVRQIRNLLNLFEIAPVNRLVLESALGGRFSDFEDAVLAEAAAHVGADGIVSRDPAGFKFSRIPVYDPRELLVMLQR